MKSVGTAAFKNNLSSYLEEVKRGKEVVITDRGKPVAKLVPIKNQTHSELSLDEKFALLHEQGLVTLKFQKDPQLSKKFRSIHLGDIEASAVLEQLRREGQ